MMTLPKPCKGTHWFISPKDAKWSRSISKIRGSKNDLGSDVTASVFVGCNTGGEGGDDGGDDGSERVE
jgi:hypothetical protein